MRKQTLILQKKYSLIFCADKIWENPRFIVELFSFLNLNYETKDSS